MPAGGHFIRSRKHAANLQVPHPQPDHAAYGVAPEDFFLIRPFRNGGIMENGGILMKNRLIHDAQLLLEHYIDPQTDIRLNGESLPLEEMASLLQSCKIPYVRKAVVMGCYCLLCLAIMRHREVTERTYAAKDGCARRILDGDYLLGIFVTFALEMKETRLMTHLNSLYKKIQLRLIQGASAEHTMAELPVQIIDYLRSEQPAHTGGHTDEAA